MLYKLSTGLDVTSWCRGVIVGVRLYRLRLITADPLSLRKRTVCDLPCSTILITPEIPYSLL